MKKPDIPDNERARLKALATLDVLDTPAEERFDRLTRMAKRLFNVPIALVSLIDENRQWFKSCDGLDVLETPRDISFCGHAILDDDVFIIPDATKDKRFSDNPLVLNDPNIRFYAGCPLVYGEGIKLGTLCIIDTVPRDVSPDDILSLKDLAASAELELAAVHMATSDELTNISNRRGFLLLAQHTLQLCIRQKIPTTMIYFDLNKFKSINDEHGHAAGDQALMSFSNELRSSCRDSDLCARFGGDEFIVLLTNATESDAEIIISRLASNIEKINNSGDSNYDLSFSYGVVEYSTDQHDTIDDLIHDADSKMYACKANNTASKNVAAEKS